jgi:PAS domain S-box-containing protein
MSKAQTKALATERGHLRDLNPELDAQGRLLEELRIHQVELEMQAQALQESQTLALRQARLYQHLLAEVPVALCRVDDRGLIVSVNRAAEGLLGAGAHVLEGRPLFLFGFNEEARRRLLGAMFEARDVLRFESPQHHFKVNDNELLIDLKFSRVPAESGDQAEWIVSLVDQTGYRREHAKLQDALDTNRDLALVADCAPIMVAICDGCERVLWVNPRFTDVTGLSLPEVQGKVLLDLLSGPDTDLGVVRQTRAAVAADGQVERVRLQSHVRQGQPRWLEMSLVAVRDDNGHLTRCIAIAEDVSEAILAQGERDVHLRNQAMHTVQSDFLSRMSHNMRTPLNAIMGFSQVMCLAPDGLQPGQLQKLQLIHDAGQQLLQMVNQALSLVRLEYQTQHFELETLSLDEIGFEAMQLLLERADEKTIHLRNHLAPVRVRANSQLVREIVANLLSNAIKYSHRDSVIEIRSAEAEGEVCLSVLDHGIGIPADSLGELFRPFSRLDNGRNMAAGHGLGLAISQQQAHLMQGRITVQSTQGEGSVFTLHLPQGTGLAQGQAMPVPVAGVAPELPASLGPLHLVYVEDDPVNRELFESVVGLYPELRLAMADTAEQGLKLVRQIEPEVVLLDINLPDGNGMDMCRAIRGWQAPGLRLVVALSADARPDQMAEAQRAGFDHYLTKPLQIERLMALLDAAQAVDRQPASQARR